MSGGATASPQAGLAAELGAFVAGTPVAALSEEVAEQGKRALLNAFGTALGSADDRAVDQALNAARALGGPGQASLIGRPECLDLMGAAFVNAIAMNLLDFDDTHLPTVVHPTAPVAPAALAYAQLNDCPGDAALGAFVLGAEVECRIANLVSPGHYARGWHITSTCGTFGAAAAVAKLMGLDADRTGHAIAIAASLAGGVVENLPTAGKNASVGNAARGGIMAAFLAAEGYEAAPQAIEGKLGWARACGDEPDVEFALRGLGESWEFLRNTYKPYPCGIVFHAIIDACLELREEGGLRPEEIEGVVVSGDALLLARGDRAVRNVRDARVSLHHAAAVALLLGRAGVPEFEAGCVQAPEIVAFRAKVRGELDPTLPSAAARVTVRTRDGGVRTRTVLHSRGSEQRPLSNAEIIHKTRMLVGEDPRYLGKVDRIVELVWQLDRARSVQPLMDALRLQ